MHRYLIGFALVVALGLLVLWSLPGLRREAVARNCLANMKSMGYAAASWSFENQGNTPTNWLCFSTELVTPKMMLCPADSHRVAVSGWASFGPENSSYEIVSGGGRWGDPKRVFFRCKVHGYVCLGNGLVLRQAPNLQ